MLHNTPCRFTRYIDSNSGQPGTSLGTGITAAGSANAMGSWTQLLGATAMPAYAIQLWLACQSSANSNRAFLADIGIDPAGGSSYSVLIPTLIFHANDTSQLLGPTRYFFPLFIPADASIAARVQCGTASLSVAARALLHCAPTQPEAWRCGSFVEAFGVDSAASSGVSITLGTTSEGAWTKIGSDSARKLWFWQMGVNAPQTSLSALAANYDLALGDGSSYDIVAPAVGMASGSAEWMSSGLQRYGIRHAPGGIGVYVRGQGSATGVNQVAVYGLGG
jgi:hypothetical protein